MKRFTFALIAVLCCIASKAAVSSVDDFVGIYTPEASGWEAISDYTTWTALSSSHEVEISKNADGTITISNLLGWNSTLVGTVDFDEQSISCAPTTLATWFTLAGADDATAYVVAQFDDDGIITFDNFQAWYGSTSYLYDGAEVKLTKAAAVTVDWTAVGTVSYYDYNNSDTPYRTAQATLTKYSGTDKYQYGLTMEGATASPSEMRFTVYEDSVGIRNGSQTAGYGGAWFYYVYDGNKSVWFDTSAGFTSFKGDENGGEFYVYHYAYNSTDNSLTYQGYFTFVWGDASGISTVASDKADKETPVYNISGVRVANPSEKGIYIKDGKKFLVK